MDDIGEWFDVGASDHGEVVLRYHSKWSSAILLRCGCRPSPNHKSQIFMFLYGWCSFTVQGFLMVVWMSSGGILCFSNECLWEREMVRDPQYILSVVSVAVVESKAKEMVSRLKPESWKSTRSDRSSRQLPILTVQQAMEAPVAHKIYFALCSTLACK